MASKQRHSNGTPLCGVQLRQLEVMCDQRGSFQEIFADDWGAGIDPSQWSLVNSVSQSLRGMHVHRRHDEYFLLLQGRVTIGLYDIRADSPTCNMWSTYELTAPDHFLSFPRGIVHGWLFHEPSTHLQAVSESYSTYGADDNNGCRWDDADLAIDWPFAPVHVSERAEAFGSLADLRHHFESAQA